MSSKQSYLPSADLLLKQYIRLAQQFTDAATPQDNFLATIASDWRYERALQGIQLLAQHHLGHLVQALIAWRQNVNEDIKKNFSSNNVVNVQGVCKRAAMEILFLEAANQVLDEFVPDFWRERHFQMFFESMQHVSFRWLLNAEEYVPHQELALVRQHVVLVSGRIVGALSRIKLSDVCAAFVKKLEERVSARKDLGTRAAEHATQRAQALKLCAGMHGIVLSFETDSQLEQSTRFLQIVHPLNYTAAVKKSQVHHALCLMLTDILTPLVRSNQPNSSSGLNPALLAEWHTQVLRLKNDIGQWANKHSKHITVGYPLVTVLVCLVDASNYSSLVDSMADFLAKQMKNKEYRSLCFKCLNQLVISSLVRNAGPSCSPQVVAWLDKIVKPVLVNARKGGISMAEQQDFVADVADLNPEYCVGSILQDLLATDSHDAQLIALRTLHLVAKSVPADSAAALDVQASMLRRSTTLAASSSGALGLGRGAGGRRVVQLPAAHVLDLIRSGRHPFELQGISHLLPRLQLLLGQLLVQYHRMYGSYLAFAADAVPKDKLAAVGLFSWVVRLVPYLGPEQWAAVRPLDLLPSYTAHVEGTVRASAFDALMSSMRACPSLRGAVLSNMAAFLGAIPDEATQTIRECLLLLSKLMEGWLRLLQEQRLASSSLCAAADESSSSSSSRGTQRLEQQQLLGSCVNKPEQGRGASSKDAAAAAAAGCEPGGAGPAAASSSSSRNSLGLDVHRLEGVLFMLLCSYGEAIRGDALALLDLTRLLHQELLTVAQLAVVGSGPAQQPQPQQQPGAAAAAAAAGGAAAGASSSNNVVAGISSSFTSVASSVAATGVQDSVGSLSLGAAGSAAAVAASGGSGSGGGFFFRHKPTMSRDSVEFMQTLGQLEAPDTGITYIKDVLEEVGADVARRCYWDFGDWSDLWRETKHVPLDADLLSVMGASDEVGGLRWMRCLVELARSACHMCPCSMGVAYMEMLHKLARYLARDSSGRLLIPAESAEGRRGDAWKAFVVVACVCPPSLWDRVEMATARKGSALAARELIRALLASLTGGSAIPQQVCLMALGHASPEHYSVLFEELLLLMDEYQRPGKQKRGNTRPEEARKMVANIMRLVADAMAPGTLSAQPLIRGRLLDWLRDTTLYLRSIAPFGEAFWEVSQVAYCLCAVSRCVAGQLVSHLTMPLALLRDSAAVQRVSSNKSSTSDAPSTPATAGGGPGSGTAAGDSSQHQLQGAAGSGGGSFAGQPMARKLLFEMFAAWCDEGTSRGAADYHARLNAGINAAIARAKDYDSDTRERLKQELVQSAELLDQASRLAMAAMLQGPVFDTDARRTAGPVLCWVDRLLQAAPLGISAGRLPSVPKDAVGRSALFQLLRSNLDMFLVCVDRCYYKDSHIAGASFQVVSEVYALHSVKVEPHVVLSLVLYKMVDSSSEVREDALHMLHVLSTREWQATADDLAAAAAAAGLGGAGGWRSAQAQQQQQQQQQDEVFALEAEGGSGTVVVLGALQDSYQQFQYQLSAKLARDHPELSEALCEEMMTRQLELADKVSQHPVLTCLSPWMENLTIAAHWKGTWCERLLKSMYYVTLRHGDELPLEIERLWSTLAANRRNIIPVLDFLASLGTHTAYQELASMLEYLGVSKRICLYLARISPQQTIDHLVYEISLQLHEDEGAAGSSGGAGMGGGAAAGGGLAAGQAGQAAATALQFAHVLAYDAAVRNFQLHQDPSANAAAAAAAAADPNLLRSSANFWWAYGSSSSLPSAAARQGPGQAGASSSGMLGAPTSSSSGFASHSGPGSILSSIGLGVGSSYPPFTPGAGGGSTYGGSLFNSTSAGVGQTSPLGAASAEPPLTTRGMRLSSTFTSVFGMGSSSSAAAAAAAVPGAGTGAPTGSFTDMSDAAVAATGGGAGSTSAQTAGSAQRPAAVDQQSDSARSSLSVTGHTSSSNMYDVTGQQLTAASAAAASLSATANSLAAAGGAAAAADGTSAALPHAVNACSSGNAAGSSSSFCLNSYYGLGPGGSNSSRAPDRAGSVIDDGGWGGTAPAAAGGLGYRGRRGSRQVTREPPSPVLRGLVTRPELALCLLTEVAYEHDEDFSSHLALLCHVCLLLVDHEEALVAAAAQQLLINCLYSLSARHLELMQEEGRHVECLQATHLIKYLQSMKGRRLWAYEDLVLGQQQQLPSAMALAGMVQHCLDSLSFEAGLVEGWVGVSLEWALHVRNRHLACRSQQVLRALQPPLSGDMCGTLLCCLQQCLAAADGSQVAQEVALELLLTMRSLLEALPVRKLLLYPQVFWSSLLLCFSSYVHIHQQALILLSTCLQQLPMHDSTTQNVLLAAAPAANPSELQQLLAHTQSGSSWLGSSSSSKHLSKARTRRGRDGASSTADAAAAAGINWSSPARSGTYNQGHAQSPAAAQAPLHLASSNAAAAAAAAAAAGVSVSSSVQSFVGGAEPSGGTPMPWAIAQLLPWPDRGLDGPAHNMIAVQQVLFKGLLFQNTQLPAVQLLTLLLRGLCCLAPTAAGALAQAPAAYDAARSGSWLRDQGSVAQQQQQQQQRSGSPASSLSSSRTGSRATTATPSRSSSRTSPAAVGQVSGTRPGHNARFDTASLQQEQLLAQVAAGQQQQQRVQHSQQQAQQGGADACAVSRSAPELRGFGATAAAAAAAAAGAAAHGHSHTLSSSGYKVAAAQSPPLDGSSSNASLHHVGSSGPMQRQQQHNAQPGLGSSWGGWSALLACGGAAGSTAAKKPPGSRAVLQSLLGHRHAQLLVSIAALVPFFCSQLGQLEPGSELLDALQECMVMLSAACSSQGLSDLGSKLQLFTTRLNINAATLDISGNLGQQQHDQQHHPGGQPGVSTSSSSSSSVPTKGSAGVAGGGLGCSSSSSNCAGLAPGGPASPSHAALLQLLQGLCLQLSRALLPTYAEWLLRFWMGVLLLPGAAALHLPMLLLLRCLFDTPGLLLGPAAASLLLDAAFISPIVDHSQGPLCQYALDALDAVIHFAANSQELQSLQQQHGPAGSNHCSSGLAATAAAGTAAGSNGTSTAAGQGVDLQGLAACLLPQLDTVELLQRVLDTCPSPAKRRKFKLLPFLSDVVVAGQHTCDENE